MSQTRPIWNDGQGLATPDLQRPCDLVGAADDRVYEVLFTPGSVQKKILPLQEETASVHPKLLAIPSAAGLTPAGVNGAARLSPCELIAGAPSSATQQISLAATLYTSLDTAAIASNSSGSIRYDLVYATISRSVSVTGTRKIKSATDGTLSSQTINLADAPAVTVGINAGFLTGATAPTLAQVLAAVPADTAPSSSTFGTFNFPVAVVTVANGYAAGTVLFQDSTGGSTYLTQVWSAGSVKHGRLVGAQPMSLYYGAANEKPTGTLGGGLQTQIAERWGTVRPFFAHFKVLSTTGATVASGAVLDSTIDWRKRIVYGTFSYLQISGNVLPLESQGATFPPSPFAGNTGNSLWNGGTISPFWTGAGLGTPLSAMAYTNSAGSVFASASLAVSASTGNLILVRGTGPIDATNGDVLVVVVYATDQMLLNA